MTSLRYTKLECSSKDVFRPPSITFLSFSFLFFWGYVLGGGGGGVGGNLFFVRMGGMDPCRSSTFREKNNVSVN